MARVLQLASLPSNKEDESEEKEESERELFASLSSLMLCPLYVGHDTVALLPGRQQRLVVVLLGTYHLGDDGVV